MRDKSARSMRTLEFITGHMVHNLAYNLILQLKATLVKKTNFTDEFTDEMSAAIFSKKATTLVN